MNNKPTTDNRQPTTILVTGGAGYIGSITTKELLDNRYEVVVLDSLENGHKEAVDKRARLEVVDLSNIDDVREVFDKYKIDAVIDFAAYLAVGESMEEPKKYLKNNIFNFLNLLDVMVENGCQYIVKSSTASTYGEPQKESDFPLKEDYQDHFKPEKSYLFSGKWNGRDVEGEEFFQKIVEYYDEFLANRLELKLTDNELTKLRIPASVYGLTKLLDEILMEKYNKAGINSIGLRYFNVCGASMDGKVGEDKPNPTTLMTMAIYNLIGRIPELKVFGNDYPTKDGTGIRDYIHPIDLATGHVAALKYLMKNNESGIFNLGNGKGYSVFEVIKSIEKASGKEVKYKIVPRRSGDPTISIADPSKAQKLLNWKAKLNLDDMSETAWKWHSQHPDGYKK